MGFHDKLEFRDINSFNDLMFVIPGCYGFRCEAALLNSADYYRDWKAFILWQDQKPLAIAMYVIHGEDPRWRGSRRAPLIAAYFPEQDLYAVFDKFSKERSAEDGYHWERIYHSDVLTLFKNFLKDRGF